MIRASCHCGAVRLEIDAPPSEVTECNCSICRRYGVLWTYYTPEQVSVLPPDPPTDALWQNTHGMLHAPSEVAMDLRVKAWHLPPRLITGAYFLNAGLSKRGGRRHRRPTPWLCGWNLSVAWQAGCQAVHRPAAQGR